MNNDQNNPQSSATHKNAGNFANDRKRAAEAGRKGGQASRGGGRRSGSMSGETAE